jgi:hypothetical protein
LLAPLAAVIEAATRMRMCCCLSVRHRGLQISGLKARSKKPNTIWLTNSTRIFAFPWSAPRVNVTASVYSQLRTSPHFKRTWSAPAPIRVKRLPRISNRPGVLFTIPVPSPLNCANWWYAQRPPAVLRFALPGRRRVWRILSG